MFFKIVGFCWIFFDFWSFKVFKFMLVVFEIETEGLDKTDGDGGSTASGACSGGAAQVGSAPFLLSKSLGKTDEKFSI